MTIKDRVLNIYETRKEALTFDEVAEELGLRRKQVQNAVDNLRDNHGYRVEYYPERWYYWPLPTPCKLFPA